MNWIVGFFLAVVVTGGAIAGDGVVKVSGTIRNSDISGMMFYNRFKGDAWKKFEKIKLDKHGNFSIEVKVTEPGSYTLSAKRVFGVQGLELYLEPGDELVLDLDGKGSWSKSVTFSGRGKVANSYLANRDALSEQWGMEQRKKPLEYSYAQHTLLKEFPGLSEKLREQFNRDLQYQRLWVSFGNMLSWYGNEEEYRRSQNYRNFYDLYVREILPGMVETAESGPIAGLEKTIDQIPSTTQREKLVRDYMMLNIAVSNDRETAQKALQFVQKADVSDGLKQQAKERFKNLDRLYKGSPSPMFSDYETVDGNNKVSLADFKGNYVVLDFWVYTCGPCIAEFPHMHKLEKEYEGKNIKFMSISMDEDEESIESWRETVAELGLEGLHLVTDNGMNADFVKFYGIAGAPHYVVIDPDGNIVSADAPLPSRGLGELLATLKYSE